MHTLGEIESPRQDRDGLVREAEHLVLPFLAARKKERSGRTR
jgi:hypothetical protein